ncbi:hypothetical protein BKA70DRAFT_1260528 [Coprinopsis sp. MPI-PUGE-AT-0042]|nr:hypothetical protein BKA70DRAFT_1260528 [Coprinopsis sp. MPI-PUGE-AT-0042]
MSLCRPCTSGLRSSLQCSRVSPRHLTHHATSPSPTLLSQLEDVRQRGHNWLISWAIHDTMSGGVSTLGLRELLRAFRLNRSHYVWKALSEAGPNRSNRERQTHGELISRAVSNGNLEMALQYLHDIRNRDLPVNARTVTDLISLAAGRDEPKLAIEIASWYEARYPDVKLPKRVWINCLVASEFSRYGEGISTCACRISISHGFSHPERVLATISKFSVNPIRVGELKIDLPIGTVLKWSLGQTLISLPILQF